MKRTVVYGIAALMGVGGISQLGAAQQSETSSVVERKAIAVRNAGESTSVLQREISLNLIGVSLVQAVEAIAKQAGARVQYRADVLEAVKGVVTILHSAILVGDALRDVLGATELEAVSSVRDMITIRERAQGGTVLQGVIVGKVVHAKTRQPVAGVTITTKNNGQRVVTGSDGLFRINADAGEHTIISRSVGFVQQEKQVVVQDEGTVTVEFVLEPSASVLDEVIVTGTVVETERRAIPNPITVITAEDIEKRGITRVEQLFRGEVPGVTAIDLGTMTYGAFELGQMVGATVYSRGASSLSQNQAAPSANPLKTYIDGVEMLDPNYLGTIDPQSIERIEIITGPQAATVYGSGAMGGVMQIFTKRGHGGSRPEVTLNLKYGLMENSVNRSLTPLHNHAMHITGGHGALFSYSLNFSHVYSGPWQPNLFSRRNGGSLGATYEQGPIMATGSVSVTGAENGTFNTGVESYPAVMELVAKGEWRAASSSLSSSPMRSKSSSQILSLSLNHRIASQLQQHMTLGRSTIGLELNPSAPTFRYTGDTLFNMQSSSGGRTTIGYNINYTPGHSGILSNNLTVGVTGSWASRTGVTGCLVAASASSYVSCSSWNQLAVNRDMESNSWGGFGSWRLGLFERFYVTFGLRGERNPSYGRNHKVDWTPTNGVTYSTDIGNLTVKLLGSYGLATRPPVPDQRREIVSVAPGYTPSQYISQFANHNLRPEYAKGPQGGIELYYANFGSLTVNRFDQTVTDLIQQLWIDTIFGVYQDGRIGTFRQNQFLNTAKVRSHGWEATASVNAYGFSMKGTYAWTDSRILEVNTKGFLANALYPGFSFFRVPTHTGNLIVGYATSRTNITVVTNIMGKILVSGSATPLGRVLSYELRRSRMPMYLTRGRSSQALYAAPGYAKSDVVIMYKLMDGVSATINVTNVANGYGSEGPFHSPALGRQTLIGLSLRPLAR